MCEVTYIDVLCGSANLVVQRGAPSNDGHNVWAGGEKIPTKAGGHIRLRKPTNIGSVPLPQRLPADEPSATESSADDQDSGDDSANNDDVVSIDDQASVDDDKDRVDDNQASVDDDEQGSVDDDGKDTGHLSDF